MKNCRSQKSQNHALYWILNNATTMILLFKLSEFSLGFQSLWFQPGPEKERSKIDIIWYKLAKQANNKSYKVTTDSFKQHLKFAIAVFIILYVLWL